MLIGILSDTHDHLTAMQTAMTALRAAGAEYFLHCGDVGGQMILDELAGAPSVFVWGNNDWDRVSLQQYADALGIRWFASLASIDISGKKFAITHGDNEPLMRKILAGQQFDYLLHGHTHVRRDQRVGRTRVINPGALYRARTKSVALLDPSTDDLRYLILDV